MSMPLSSKESGLTLLELLIAIAILLIAFDFGLNAFENTFSGALLQRQEESWIMSLRAARHAAMISDTPVTVKQVNCNLTFLWYNNETATSVTGSAMPVNLPSLPRANLSSQNLQCQGDLSGYWLPSGIFTQSLSSLTPTDTQVSISNQLHQVTIVINGGGAINHG